jgi:uncharacterized protein
MGPIQRRLLKVVLAIVEFPRTALVICAAVLVLSVGLALLRLQVDTDQDKLFSSHVAFFKDYLDYINKFPENEALYVLVEPADRAHPPPLERWTALADAETVRLRALTGTVSAVESRTPISALGSYALLFSDRQQLEQAFAAAQQHLIPLARLWAARQTPGVESPMQRFLLGLSLAGPDVQKAQFAKILADSWSSSIHQNQVVMPDLATLDAQTPTDLGYSYVPDQTDPSNHLLLIAVYLAEDNNSFTADEQQVDDVRKATADAAAAFPEFHVAVTGRPVLNADETRTSDTDSTRAEIIALTVIFLGLVFVFRSLWMAAVAEISLTVAIGWTFGWATISVGELNILSLVFLITLIGIGMDYLVQILTRYRREARLYVRPKAVWARVFKHVSPPICTACLGAAGAFFVSIFTDFRGAAELGVIAGGGLLLCLASGYTVLPAIMVLWPPNLGPLQPDQRYGVEKRRSFLSRMTPPACYVVALIVVLPYCNRTYFNPNLLDMQAQNLPSVQLVRKLQTWYAVVISRDLSMLRRVRDAVRASPTVDNTDSILEAQDNYGWLQQHQNELPVIDWADPPPIQSTDLPAISSAATLLAAQLDIANFPDAAGAMRQFAANAHGAAVGLVLSQWQHDFVQQLKSLRSEFSPPPLEMSQLPDELRNHLISADGYYALYVNPKENLWKRQPLEQFVLDVEGRMAAIPGSPSLTGIAPEIYHSTRSIELAFYKATAYALGLVLILVFLDLRSIPQTLMTVSVLGLGLPMLVGLMGLLGIDWNFANFFGLPILIGAGHEYGVFMMHRYRESMDDPRRVWRAWDVSDRALLLCAFVTTSSFAFFWWLGHHEGLKSLGLVMAMGTACIYLSALLVVRPLLKWRIERAGHCGERSAATKVG